MKIFTDKGCRKINKKNMLVFYFDIVFDAGNKETVIIKLT